MPTLARNVHTQDARAWRTRCSTPRATPGTPSINTAYFVASGDNAISLAETGRYEFTINDSHCVADVRRGASLSRALAATSAGAATRPDSTTATAAHRPRRRPPLPSPVPSPRAEATAVPRADCSDARGGRRASRCAPHASCSSSVTRSPSMPSCSTPTGCPTGTPIQWAIGPVVFKDGQDHGGAPTIDPSGNLDHPAVRLHRRVLRRGGHGGGQERARLRPGDAPPPTTRRSSRSRGSVPAVSATSQRSPSWPRRPSDSENARAEDGARKRRLIFIGVVAGLTLLLLVVAIVGAARSRKGRKVEAAAEARHAEKMRDYERHKAQREAQHAAQMKAHLESVARRAAAGRGVGRARAGRRADVLPVVPARVPVGNDLLLLRLQPAGRHPGTPGVDDRALRRHLPDLPSRLQPGVKVCSHDGDTLVPAVAAGVAQAPSFVPLRGKICPTCGGRFEGAAAFCVNDGTQLVLLN